MTKIWDSGAYSDGTLLVLLALADFAGDDGKRIFPHVDTLAKKARLSVRATQMALATLKADGILIAVGNASGGRGKSVEYQMDLERVNNLHEIEKGAVHDTKGCNPRQERVQSQTERVQFATSHIDNHQEPSKEPSIEPSGAGAPGPGHSQNDLLGPVPPKPKKAARVVTEKAALAEAYALYDEFAERLDWAKCQMRTAMRDGHLRKRLEEAGGIEGWRAALNLAEASDFLCGKVPPGEGHTQFRLDIDFLLTQSKFVKLMEGKYGDRSKSSRAPQAGIRASAARVAARRAAGGLDQNDHDQGLEPSAMAASYPSSWR